MSYLCSLKYGIYIFLLLGIGFIFANESEISLHGINDLKEVKKLIESGADINARDGEGNTPLHTAVYEGALSTIEFLQWHGADPSIRNERGETPIEYNNRLAISQTRAFGLTLAIYDVLGGPARDTISPQVGVIPSLLGVIPSLRLRKLKEVEEWIKRGADVKAVDGEGNTPLHILIANSLFLVSKRNLKALVEAGADVNARNLKGRNTSSRSRL